MPELHDFPLHQPPEEPERNQAVRLGPLVAVILILGVATAGIVYWLSPSEDTDTEPGPMLAKDPITLDEESLPNQPEPEVSKPLTLPDLDRSDLIVRDLVTTLSAHPGLTAWLASEALIRRFTVSVENIADGRNPAKHLPILDPNKKFKTVDQDGRVFIDQSSYDRYNIHGDVIASLDAPGCARLYMTLKPLIDEAYRDLGHPNGGFDGTLERAINRLLETPVVERNAAVIPRLGYHEFSDAELESLAPVQKQFLGMGPRNVRLLQGKLRELAVQLGIPEISLPTQVVIVN